MWGIFAARYLETHLDQLESSSGVSKRSTENRKDEKPPSFWEPRNCSSIHVLENFFLDIFGGILKTTSNYTGRICLCVKSETLIFKNYEFMKKLNFSTILCLYMMSIVTSVASQTATGGCSTVKVTNTPSYNNSLFFGCSFFGVEQCALFITSASVCPPKQAQYQLERQLGAGWTVVVSWQNGANFSNLTIHGTYRVAVRIPVLVNNELCEGGCRKIYESGSAQWIGCLGQWSQTMYTNTVIVGNTVPADNSYTFIDVPETGSENTYDYGEVVKINTAACANYDQWWVAIIENGGANRYNSWGWSFGTIPNNEVNLTQVWKKDHPTWEFEVNRSYTVQFVVENQQCLNGSGWNVNNRDFFICQPGSGCRTGEDSREIAINPNPASSYILLQNFEPDLGRDYRMLVSDLSGKVVKSVELTDSEVDISSLPSGMFVVNVLRDGQRVHQSKLVVTQQ